MIIEGDVGVTCSSVQNVIDVKFGDEQYTSNQVQDRYDISINYPFDVDKLLSQNPIEAPPIGSQLIVNGYNLTEQFSNLVKCVVLPVDGVPELTSDEFLYYKNGYIINVNDVGTESPSITIKFNGVNNC